MKAHLFALSFLGFSLFSSPKILATGAIAGATEMTQILNHAELAASYVELAQQTVDQANHYKNMLKHLTQMTPSHVLNQAAQKLWIDQDMRKVFSDLNRIVVAGQTTSYSLASIDSQFKQLHPGYKQFNKQFDFGTAYRNWSENSLNTIKNAMALVGVHSNALDSEAAMMKELDSKSQTAEGQLQALQAGNQVGIATISQLQQLRQLQMAQMQAQNAFFAAQQSREDASDETLRRLMGNRTKVRSISEINRERKRPR
jgi:P-type conjugative transfer protein TrbJ